MSQYRTDEEVRNFDIFKGVITALLLLTLFLSVALGGSSEGDAAESAAETDAGAEIIEEGAVADDEIAGAPLPAEISAPDLLSPSPESELEAGPQTFSGMGYPSSIVLLTAAGSELGRSPVSENGTWEMDVDLPQGIESIQLQTLDSDGSVAASSEEIPLTVAPAAAPEEAEAQEPDQEENTAEDPAAEDAQEETTAEETTAEDAAGETAEAPSVAQSELPVPEFNPLTGSLALEGASAAGARVAAIIDDQVVDSVTADSEGNWQLNIAVEPGTYDLAFGQLDESGNVTSRSEPVAIEVPAELPQLDLPDFSLPDNALAAIAGAAAAGAIADGQEAAETTEDGETAAEPTTGEDGAETADETADSSADSAGEADDTAGLAAARNALDGIALPEIKLPAGPVEWQGSAEPGSEVAVVVDGEIAGTATADEQGRFSLPGELAAGISSLQLGTIGADGALAAKSREIALSVADMQLPSLQMPELTGDEASVPLSGTAEPGATVEITADGETVGETTAGPDGAWSYAIVPLAAAASVRVQAISEDGQAILQSSPIQLPGSADVAAEAPAEGEAETPTEGEAEAPAEGEAETPAEGEAEAPAEGVEEASVTGDVTYVEPIALPDGAVITVQIQDVSRTDGVAIVMGEQIIEAAGQQVPISYEVLYDAAQIDEQFTYSMRARIEDSDGTLLFTNDSAIPVITRNNPTVDVEIETVQVRSAASDAELGQTDVDLDVGADTVVEATEAAGSFSVLLDGLEAAGLTQTLEDVDGAYTLFAPTDDAFAALPPGIVAGWNANPEEYANILRNLVVEGSFAPEDLTDGMVLRSIVGTNIGIRQAGEKITINGVPVIDAAGAGDSIVYALPQVILPPLPAGVSAPIIDESGVPFFIGELLTVVGRGEPGQRIVLAIDEERFGAIATVDPNGFWLVSDNIDQGIHYIVAYLIDDSGLVRALSQEVVLAVP